MNIGARLRALVQRAWPGVVALPWLGPRIEAGGAAIPAGVAVTPSAALALTATYRACSLLADAASAAPPALYRRKDRGGREQERDTPPARALATLTHADAELFGLSTALFGNGFLRILRDGNGAPYELRAVPTWRVQLELETGNRRVWYRIAADSSVEELEVVIPEGDMVHARFRLTGSNRLWGVPPVASCAPSFALALQSRDVQRALFQNLAVPGGALLAPGKIEAAVANRLRAEWDANFRGDGVGRTAVLGNGLKFEPIRFSAVDSQLLEQVQATTQDIARAFGVPRQFLEDSSAHLTYASAAEGTRALYSLALRGFCRRLADALAQRLLTRNERAAGATIEHDLSSMLVLPGSEQAEFLSKLANAGLATPNELRNQYLNLPDVAGGDTLRAPVNTLPSDQWAQGGASQARTLRQLERYHRQLDEYREELEATARAVGASTSLDGVAVPFGPPTFLHMVAHLEDLERHAHEHED